MYYNELKREMREIQEKQDKNSQGVFHLHKKSNMRPKPPVTVCIDFDGTCVKHEYPYVGEDVENCVDILKHWVDDYNVGLILDTMRDGETLKNAIKWFEDRDIKLYSVSCDPNQTLWTTSPKAYAPFSIDDRNIGCPLIYKKHSRPYVDWKKVQEIFEPIIKSLI